MRPLRLEILVEDRSGAMIVEALLRKEIERLARKIAPHQAVHIEAYVRPHQGLGHFPEHPEKKPSPMAGGLLNQLPAKLRAYERFQKHTPCLLLLCFDSDEHDPDQMRARVEQLIQENAPNLRTVIGIAIEELEAWILGDELAIQAAYPHYDRMLYEAYEQDSVGHTWERLCHILEGDKAERIIEEDYPTSGRYKTQWAARISPELDPERNVSPSWQAFRRATVRALKEALRDLSKEAKT